MRTAYAFFKKEWMEYYRSGKLFIVGIVFMMFGIMNPAIAKLTPFLMEKLVSEESGMTVIIADPDATMSWAQFYKNIPMALIVCVLLFGSILTTELQKGTLTLVLTKGLSRGKVLLTKAINLITIWTISYWLCFGITYFYTGYYWDNGILSHLVFAGGCYWLFGAFVMALVILFSAMSSAFGGVVLGVGAFYFGMTFLGMIPKFSSYLPTYLTNVSGMLAGGNTEDFLTTIVITVIGIVGSIAAGCLIFNKREIV